MPRHDVGFLVVTDTLCSRGGTRYSQFTALETFERRVYQKKKKNSLSKKFVFPSIEISSIQSNGFSVW